MGSPASTTIMKLLVLLITLTGAMATDPEFRFLFQTITRVTTLTKTATTTSTVLPACVSDYAALAACKARKKRSPRDLSVETPVFTVNGKTVSIDQIMPTRTARAELPESEIDASSFGEVDVVAKGSANLDHQRLNLFKVYATSTKTITSTATVLKNGATTMKISLAVCQNADFLKSAGIDLLTKC